MKTKDPARKIVSRRLWLALVSVSLLAVGLVVVLEKQHVIDLVKNPFTPQVPQQKTPEEQIKVDQANKKSFVENTDTQPTTQNNTVPQSPAATISPTQSGDSVVVKTNLRDVAEGICELKVSSARGTFTEKAQVIYQADFSSCAGFSIPISKGGAGHWVLTLSLNGVVAATAEVEVQ